MPNSWVKNMTTWFQVKRNQDRSVTSNNKNDHAESLAINTDNEFVSKILDIHHKRDPKDHGPKQPNKR